MEGEEAVRGIYPVDGKRRESIDIVAFKKLFKKTKKIRKRC